MRVTLQPPADWTGALHAGIPTFRARPPREVAIQIGALVVAPDDLAAWHTTNLRSDLRDDAVVTPTAPPRELETDDGWRARATYVRVTTADGALVEHRALVEYAFLHTVAAVLVRGRGSHEELDAPDVQAMLRSLRPDFRDGTPVSLAELWDVTGR